MNIARRRWVRAAARCGTLEAGLVENFISFDNTPDVAFHFGFTQRL